MNSAHFTSPPLLPSSDVSPTALVDALIALSNSIITLRSNSFPIHGTNVRRIIRLTELLLQYFQEIIYSRNIVLALSELYVTLQRVKNLVEDCARPGARLWTLARSERVSGEFRSLTKSLSIIVDVLHVSGDGKSTDTEDLLRFIREQSWKAVVETETADKEFARLLWAVLSQFKNGVAPAKAELRRIVEHLGVKSWGECGEEISFLEEMVGGQNGDDRMGFLASDLIGFMVYCRVVLFDDIDGSDNRKKCLNFCKLKAINEDDFRCPISLEIMRDPVTVATGQTYDRSSILKWFEKGCITCPVTGEKLDEASFVPNLNLSNIIENYCRENDVPFVLRRGERKHESSRSSVNSEALRMTAKFLVGRLKYGSDQEKNKAAFEIRNLSKYNLFNRECFVEAGAVPWLLYLFASFNSAAQDNAVAALLNLSKNESGRASIVKAGGLKLVVEMIKMGTKVSARQNAAGILFYISSVAKYRKEIGDVSEAIPALVGLLGEGTRQTMKNVTATIYELLLRHENHRKALETGAVAALTKLLSSKDDELAFNSLTILAKMAERPEGAKAILNSPSLPHLVNVLQSTTSPSVKDCCVSLLLSLCNRGGEEVARVLKQSPRFVSSLYSVVTEGSPQASKKAKIMLKYFHLLDKPDYHALIAPEQFVRLL